MASAFLRRRLVQYVQSTVADNWHAAVALCDRCPGATHLDIGCGDGAFTSLAASHIGAGRVIGVDVLPTNLEHARTWGVRGILANLDQGLPVVTGRVDVVTASHVIEHLSDTDGFVRECHRVLRPGGSLVIATPNLAAWPNVLFLLFGQQPPSTTVSDVAPVGLWSRMWGRDPGTGQTVGHVGSNKHRRVFVRSTLAGLLEYHGFRVERVAVAGFPPFSGRAAAVLCRVLPVYGWQLTVRARKP